MCNFFSSNTYNFFKFNFSAQHLQNDNIEV